ncbi:ABC transporter substrate-binding protein [Labrys sp. WJW]|uniref:peptide ABC transporter substrate-binding protein n=1 Tax=Labrys sp. WJW TaxID=1737983 RepID=UPI0008317D63|nr:peptide ABC transporter substrate-binding protein [Labrys sp. WJW]OCC04122.1 ABC transporter substrate-binding protein [Labrys sp. WJW]
MTAALKTRLLGALLAVGLLSGTALSASAETVLNKGLGGEPQSLDPIHTTTNIEQFIIDDLYEGLTAYDGAGKVGPAVAESWTVSPDGLVYTFKLRPSAKWSNGDPVTAEDFVYSFRRNLDPKEAGEYASLSYPIKNAQAINTGKAAVDTLGVKAIDAGTLEITLESPVPFFPELLAHQSVVPVNKANVEKYGRDFAKAGKLVSNGAYTVTEQIPGDHLTFVKNPNYWGAANVKIDRVVAYPSEDQAAIQRRFLAGELDLAYQFQADQRKFLQEKVGDEVHVSPSTSSEYYAFDTRKPPFDDIRVRRAFAMAIDRDFLANDVLNGVYQPLYSWIPEGIANYTPAKADFADTPQLDREDKAKELLKEAGYGPGGKPLKVEIRYNTNENWKKVATAIADMWKGLGAEVTMLNSDLKSHYSYLQQGNSFDVTRAGWVADYADPENFLTLGVSTNKVFNYGHYNNPEFDALMAKSFTERDVAKRMQILHDAEAMLLRDASVTPLLVYNDPWLVSKKVKGWHDNLANHHGTRFLTKE